MALAKKGTRRISVNGVPYRWVVSRDDGYMVLVAERADGPGQRLEAFFKYHDVHEPDGPGAFRVVGQRRSISPGVVRAVILAALALGWQPSVCVAKAFRIQDADSLVPVSDETAGPGAAAGLPSE
jgi:hypothetical protein